MAAQNSVEMACFCGIFCYILRKFLTPKLRAEEEGRNHLIGHTHVLLPKQGVFFYAQDCQTSH